MVSPPQGTPGLTSQAWAGVQQSPAAGGGWTLECGVAKEIGHGVSWWWGSLKQLTMKFNVGEEAGEAKIGWGSCTLPFLPL